jgi:histidine triad (HIT) family protein
MATIFSKIVSGEIPSHKVYEDERHLAFLDIFPIVPGHVLVIPKREVSYLFDLAAEEYDALWKVVRHVEKGVRQGTGAKRVVISVVGWEVPHVHVHLVPTKQISDFPFPGKQKQTPEQLAATAAAIRKVLPATKG